MKKYTYSVEPWGFEVQSIAETQRDARKKAWESLTDDQKDNCEYLDWIDEEEVE